MRIGQDSCDRRVSFIYSLHIWQPISVEILQIISIGFIIPAAILNQVFTKRHIQLSGNTLKLIRVFNHCRNVWYTCSVIAVQHTRRHFMYGELKKIFESIILVSECINIIRFIIEQYISQLKRLIITSAVITKKASGLSECMQELSCPRKQWNKNFTLSYPPVSKSAAIAGHITLFINILFRQMSLWLFQKSHRGTTYHSQNPFSPIGRVGRDVVASQIYLAH